MLRSGQLAACRSRPLAGALVLVLLATIPATAQPPASGADASCRVRSVAILFVGSDSGSAREFEHAVRSAVSRRACYKVIDVVDHLEAGMGEGLLRLETARAEAEEGTRAFLDMRLAEARPHLVEAVSAYQDGFAYLPYAGPLVEALMVLGACEAALSNDAAAREAFLSALALDPDANPAEVSNMPEVARAFDAARAVAGRGASGALIVETSPPHAEVFLDGRRFLGVTPLDVPDIPAGPHLVVLRKPGYVRKTVRVVVPPDGSAAVLGDQGALSEARRKPLYDTVMHKLAASADPTDNASAVEDIKALFLADLALVVHFSESPRGMSAHAALWDLATMQRVYEGSEPPVGEVSLLGEGAAESLAGAALARFVERAEVRESGAATYEGRKSGAIWSRWWFWTAVGAVVVGGVTATVLLTRPKAKTPGLPREQGTGAVIIRF